MLDERRLQGEGSDKGERERVRDRNKESSAAY